MWKTPLELCLACSKYSINTNLVSLLRLRTLPTCPVRPHMWRMRGKLWYRWKSPRTRFEAWLFLLGEIKQNHLESLSLDGANVSFIQPQRTVVSCKYLLKSLCAFIYCFNTTLEHMLCSRLCARSWDRNK